MQFITSFVGLYVSGVDDVNYNRPLFGYIISIVGFFFATRIPYEDVTRAAGHYKETRNGAILEALINIIISIILVFPLGIIGIAIGSLVAMIFRTIQYGYYSSKHLLSRPLSEILKRYVVSAITILLGLIIILFIPMQNPVNFFEWILNGFITAGVMIFITLLSSIIFYREELINLKTLINRLLKLRPKNGIKNN